MFRITQADDSIARTVHNGSAITVRTVVTVVEPASATWDELTRWIESTATWDSDMEEWTLEDDEIGEYTSMGDEDIQTLVSEIASALNEYGVSFDVPAYKLDD